MVEKKRVGKTWNVNRAVYDWWRAKLKEGHNNLEGHRYWSIMVLFVYASKCKIPFFEAMKDAMGYLRQFDALTKNENNYFTKEDIQAASKAYHDNSCKFPIKKIEALTLFRIDTQSRRNGRTRAEHIKLMNLIRDNIKYADKDWRNKDGRPKEQEKVQEWRVANPTSTNKSQCARDLGLSRTTIHKWWDSLHEAKDDLRGMQE